MQIFYHYWDFGELIDGMSTWTWGRIAGTAQEGWFWDGGLDGRGAHAACFG